MSPRSGYHRVDREPLRLAVLDGDALAPFMRADPHRAADLLRLAVVDPLARSRRLFDDEGSLHITDAPHWLGPVPERGPFLLFLQLAPQVALDLTIEIVEMATELWRQQATAELQQFNADDEADDYSELIRDEADESSSGASPLTVFEVIVDGEPVDLIGDVNVLQWHRGEDRVPTVLATMLMAVELWFYHRLDSDENVDDDLQKLLASRSAALWGLAAEVAAYRPELLRGPLTPLVTSGELLLADRSYRGMPRTHLSIVAMGQGAWGERIHSWNGMDHRQRMLFESLMLDVFSDGPLKAELEAARKRWAARAPERLKHLLAQTDLNNRQVRKVDDDTFVLDYVPPPEVAEEIAESNRQMQATQLWIMGPYRMRELIDGDRELSDEEVESLWALAGQSAGGMPEDMSLDGVRSAADVECGVAAALVHCGSSWLESHPDAQLWCRERLLAPFIARPPTHMFDSEDAIATESWDAFCADALPRLLANSPNDIELRRAIAQLATHHHYATVRRVMYRIGLEPSLANELRQLEHVALIWSRWLTYRRERQRREDAASYEWQEAPSVEDLPDVESPTREAVIAFERGELGDSPRLTDWVASTPEGLVTSRRGRNRALSVLDAEYLLAAFDHLLNLQPELEPDELERRLLFAEDLADLIAQGMEPEDDGRVDGTPYEHENTALDRLGKIAVHAPAERAVAIWRPLLAPGAAAEYWVESFLRAVWRAVMEVPPSDAGRLVMEMVTFAENLESWEGFRRTDITLSIVGIDPLGATANGPAIAAIMPEMRETWIRWVSSELEDSRFAERALRFLATEDAEEVLEPMFIRLAELEPDRHVSSQSSYDDELGEMLAALIVRRPELFTDPGPGGDALRVLLSRLAERGSALALEIVNQLT